MKKPLLFEFTKSHSQKMTFRIAAFAVLFLLTTQFSFAQKWNKIAQGTEISGAAASVSYTSITVVGNVPYVAYVESAATASGAGKVKMRNASTGTWEPVGGDLSANISYTRIYSDKTGKLYVTYVDNNNGNKLVVATYNGAAWVTVGGFVSDGSVTHTVVISGIRSDLAFDTNNIPYITYAERAVTGTTVTGAYVKRFNGTSWEAVGSLTGLVSADPWVAGNSIALDAANVPYVVYIKQAAATTNTGLISVFRVSSSNAWENLAIPAQVLPGSATSGATSSTRHSSIAIDGDNNPFVSYFNVSSSSKSTQIRYTNSTSTWDYIGSNGTRDGNRTTLINDKEGNLYNVFIDLLANPSTTSVVRVYKRNAATTSAFFELVNTPVATAGVGIESAVGSATIINPGIALGTDLTKPYIVYTVSNLPVVQVLDPLITTTTATSITATGATVGGELLASAPPVVGTTITERGIVYGATVNPTTANTVIKDATATTGTFSATIAGGLTAATTYNVRAYFIYSDGAATPVLTTVYGDNRKFTTTAALGTDSFEKSDMVKAYPNPTTDSVTVSLPSGAIVQKIAVYNNLGQLVLTEAKNTVSLQSLANGTYYLTIYSAEGSYSKKIIKK